MGCKYFIWLGNVAKVSVNNFEWIEDTSQFNKYYVKDYNGISDERYFLEVSVQYTEKLHELQNDLPFLPERIKIENVEKLLPNLHAKAEYVVHTRNYDIIESQIRF